MRDAIEVAMLLVMAVGIIGGVWNRLKLHRGIGLRFIQYLGLTVLMPVVAILSLEGRISGEVTGAIAAAAVGAVLTSIGKKKE